MGTVAQRIGMVDRIGTLQSVIDQATGADTPNQGTAAQAASMLRVEGVTVDDAQTEDAMTLEGMRDALATAPRQGAEDDQPEGARYVQISATLAARMVGALDHANAKYVALAARADQMRARLDAVEAEGSDQTRAAREAMADNLLAAADLPPLSVELDARFAADLRAVAVAADSDDSARTAMQAAIEDRAALVQAARTPARPHVGRPENQVRDDAADAIRRVRSSVPGLEN